VFGITSCRVPLSNLGGFRLCLHCGTAGMTVGQLPPQVPHTPALPTYNARDLTQSGELAQIVLEGQIYTLRITRAGKLILTK